MFVISYLHILISRNFGVVSKVTNSILKSSQLSRQHKETHPHQNLHTFLTYVNAE